MSAALLAATGLAVLGAARAATLPAGTEAVPLDIQDVVQAAISEHFVLPQTARWDFQFMASYSGSAKVVCGRVDFQSAMRKYVGYQRFYAIVRHGTVQRSQLQDPSWVDTTGAEARTFDLLCNRG